MAVLEDIFKEKEDSEDKKLDKQEILDKLDYMMDPEEIVNGLQKLADLGAIHQEIDPKTDLPQYCLPEDSGPKELLPILKDLLKDNKSKPIKEDKIKEACKGKLKPE